MTRYPLVVSFSEVLEVAGVQVRVHGDTPVLAQGDGVNWRCLGVRSGGTSGSGITLIDAYMAFRRDIRLAIEDCAFDDATLAAFTHDIECVFSTVDPLLESQWQESLEDLRNGAVTPGAEVQGMPRVSATALRPITVERLPSEAAGPDTLARAA